MKSILQTLGQKYGEAGRRTGDDVSLQHNKVKNDSFTYKFTASQRMVSAR